MKKYFSFSLIVIALFTIGCDADNVDYQLQQSIFIEDPINPGLPQYSEWGYNTFGAYIDRQPFVSNAYDLPSKIIVYPDTLNMLLTGEMNYKKVTLTFSFIGYAPKEHTDLINMSNDTIDLSDPEKCRLTLKIDDDIAELNPFNGSFVVSKVQNLYVDKKLEKSIFSGFFHFQTSYKNEYITINNGRFDLGIGYDNFYYIKK